MRRFAAAAIFAILIVVASPVAAQEDARILKGDARVPTQLEAPDGWEMYSLPIEPGMLTDFRSQQRAKKTMFIALSYASISKPEIGSGIDAFDITPLSFADYWHGIVIFNLSANAKTVKVKIKAKGASKQTLSGTFTIPANSIVLITGEWGAFGEGVVFFKTTVTGSKAVTTAVCSGC